MALRPLPSLGEGAQSALGVLAVSYSNDCPHTVAFCCLKTGPKFDQGSDLLFLLSLKLLLNFVST